MKIASLLLALLLIPYISYSQEEKLVIEPENLIMEVGDNIQLNAYVVGATGERIDREVRMYSKKSKAVAVDADRNVTASQPGDYSIIVISPHPSGDRSLRLRVDYPVKVNYPKLAKIQIGDIPEKIYLGTTIQLDIQVFDETGFEREDVRVTLETDSKASADPFYNVTVLKEGVSSITAKIEGIENTINVNIVSNPVSSIELNSDKLEAMQGDVLHFEAITLDKKGNEINDTPITYAFTGKAYDVSSSASGLIKQDGRFVADEPGLYTITASCGSIVATKTINVIERGIERKVELVGHGNVGDKHTSDFWIWEGVDGRDYAVTGTWGADGTAYFWDVTNPGNITKIDSVQVDARTVNDVKISEDGKLCIISREGASNRKNGIVIIDVTNPRDAKVISTFTENLTGGVHNLFIYGNHVYALSAGQKYYIINIDDPSKPRIVSKFELDTPGHSIHDVWVEDGIAYSSNWSDGIQLVDVGNGVAGGSPENPVQFASYAYPSGANHATFPYRSKDTGKFYVIGGDEIFPYGLNMKGPNIAGGFLHFIDFTDLDNPEEIARFEVPGAGSHNYWVDGDLLYAAFYNGGIRVIDISGELMGDLKKQGREIGFILPSAENGYVPNSPFTWGAQLHKGTIFYSDWNSGLWAAKLEPAKPADTKIQTR
ncbi:MAG: hypothetical protein RJQ09_11540 [Cyclobacteriaceae bacterium]